MTNDNSVFLVSHWFMVVHSLWVLQAVELNNQLGVDLFLLMNRRTLLLAIPSWSVCKASMSGLLAQSRGMIHGVSCAGPRAGLNNSHQSCPTQHILGFYGSVILFARY